MKNEQSVLSGSHSLYSKYVSPIVLVLFGFCFPCCSQGFMEMIPSNGPIHVSHYMDFQKSISASSRQGCAVYGDELFVFHNSNDIIEVYSMTTKKLRNTIQLSGGDLFNEQYHCNNANFGKQKYSENDAYPLLYVSMEHIYQHSVFVFRIQESNNSIGIDLVQRIELPSIKEVPLYYTNSYLDLEEDALWISGYTSNSFIASEDNHLEYVKYAVPNVYLGENIILQKSDILFSCLFESISATQGGIIVNGKLNQVFGVNSPRYYVVFDLNNSVMVSKIELYSVDCEPEGLFFWHNSLFYTTEQSVYSVIIREN